MARRAWSITPPSPVDYDSANAAMHDLAARRLDDAIPDAVVMLEHPPVFTAGRRARPDELLWSGSDVEARGGLVRRIDRGGAYTFHGPGQLVGYPILHLGPAPDAVGYLRRLEEVVIGAAAEVGVPLHRRDDVQTGVWHGNDKVCAIGVRLQRARVTLHGFALNCTTDLSWYEGIVACGLPGHGVTSLSAIVGQPITVDRMRPIVQARLASVFDLMLEPAPEAEQAAFGTAAATATAARASV